jgi:hypothetical protein
MKANSRWNPRRSSRITLACLRHDHPHGISESESIEQAYKLHRLLPESRCISFHQPARCRVYGIAFGFDLEARRIGMRWCWRR